MRTIAGTKGGAGRAGAPRRHARAPALVAGLLLLTACTPQSQDQIARNAARSALTPVVMEQFPGVPVEPTLNCLIDNASAQQIRTLAADALLGPNENTLQITRDIASKPETLRCLATTGLPALLR
ncbi:hypothetical protein [Maliponia aquimaris]|uniref:Uncharacterized protein n=1 Tax=Maliponia aquimaris TaxID=1673631 RepID=A0A238KX79_9RHOB|nr:hypothetical protein [Maliponia aquimaris]SMX47298.1 hypothetical protein MAA8898_03623 [Maliponia aquimaris]